MALINWTDNNYILISWNFNETITFDFVFFLHFGLTDEKAVSNFVVHKVQRNFIK